MKLGIIGAENTHTAAIANLLNVQKAIPGFSVTHVWGETADFAQKAAEAGKIPTIVRRPADLIGQVDCVMIDHRDGKHHLKPAKLFVDAGLPVFVDKPMSTSLAAAKAFLRYRRTKKVPVTTMSALPNQACVKEVREQMKAMGGLKAIHLNGPGDYKSPYGGIWFYGIHQVDLLIDLLGAAPKSVQMVLNDGDCTAVCGYADFTATMTFVSSGLKSFSVTLVGAESSWNTKLTFDPSPYLPTAKLFTRMFKTRKEPFGDQRMLMPIATLEAMQKSIAKGAAVKVAAV